MILAKFPKCTRCNSFSHAVVVLLFGMFPAFACSQPLTLKSVRGAVVGDHNPLPQAGIAVALERKDAHAVIEKTVTDGQGHFLFTQVPAGEYSVVYGSDGKQSMPFAVRTEREAIDLGALETTNPALKLDKFEVKGTQQEFYNSIDRKIYSVGQEIQSATGSASDLLQNIPSVQVDIDGNVSLRGSDNVTILIDGRASTLMGKNRADALSQFPANQIDKIEVITNPSAKYKPDGTGGIINIVLKKKHAGGSSTTVTGNIGPDNRYNSGISTNYATGKYNIFASYSVRQDDRSRQAGDIRTIIDPVSGVATTLNKKTAEHARPFTRTARATADYQPDEHNKIGATGSYNHRTFNRSATDHNVVTDATGAVTSDYDRTRYDPEFEDSREFAGTYQHTFATAEHTLNLEFKSSTTNEQEDNHYSNIYQNPALPTTSDNTRIRPSDRETEGMLEYVLPIDDHSRLEAGYTRSEERLDTDFAVSSLDPATGVFINDPTKSNRFNFKQTIHAFYLTYARTLGRFGFLAGLRPEQAKTKSLLVNTGETIPSDYFRVYPSLHLSYKTSEHQELQLNYSHRVRRPESDDLNPFPEYSDPFTLRAGNPRLRPEDIHSIEAGYQYRDDQKTFVATLYQRYLYNGFTNVTRDIGNSVLLTTHENLATSRFTGLELSATTDLGKKVSLNFSSNTYFNSIDASNLGFTGTKSDISWSAKLGATVRLPKEMLLQFNTNYTSTRLTPQGSRRPTYIANLGLRREFLQKKLALVVTISDLFNSLKDSTVINTPLLKEVVTRRRSSRIVYVGFSYSFGQQSKKKDDALKFDESI